MIYGIGTDIIAVERFSKYTLESAFIKKYFTPGEIEYCRQYVKWQERIAGFFAAKEAFSKALKTGIRGEILLNRIWVSHDSNGAPYLDFDEPIKMILNEKKITGIHLSISHSHDTAIAFVVLEHHTS